MYTNFLAVIPQMWLTDTRCVSQVGLVYSLPLNFIVQKNTETKNFAPIATKKISYKTHADTSIFLISQYLLI